MDKAQRAQLLRERFKAVGGSPFEFTGVRKPKPVPRPKPNRVRIDWPQANTDTRRAGVWMHEPDPKPKPTPRVKHSQGKSAVTRIAEKAPKKLSLAFATAEALLAARARR
jgi:hypothetical protein